jgi:hypothetical protein
MRSTLSSIVCLIAALSVSAAQISVPRQKFAHNNYEDAGVWRLEDHLQLEAFKLAHDPEIHLGWVDPRGPNRGDHSSSSHDSHEHFHSREVDYDSREHGSHDVHFSAELAHPLTWSQDALIYMDGSHEHLSPDVVLDPSKDHKHRIFSLLMPLVPEKNPESSDSSTDSNSVDGESSDSTSGDKRELDENSEEEYDNSLEAIFEPFVQDNRIEPLRDGSESSDVGSEDGSSNSVDGSESSDLEDESESGDSEDESDSSEGDDYDDDFNDDESSSEENYYERKERQMKKIKETMKPLKQAVHRRSEEDNSEDNSEDSHDSHDFHHSQDQSLDEWDAINIENSEEECWRLWYSRSADIVWSNRLEKVNVRPIAFEEESASREKYDNKIVKVVSLEDYQYDLNRVNYIEIHSVNFFEEVLPDLFIVGLEDEFHPLEFKKPAVIVSLVRSDIEYTQKQVARSLRGSAYINNAEIMDINRLDRLRFHQERTNLRENILSILNYLEHFKNRIKVVERVHTSQFGIFTVERDYAYLRYWVEESIRLKCEYFQDFYRRLRYALPPSELARLFEGIFEFEQRSEEDHKRDPNEVHFPSYEYSIDSKDHHHDRRKEDKHYSEDEADRHFIQNGFQNKHYHGAPLDIVHTAKRHGQVVFANEISRNPKKDKKFIKLKSF